jgi:hypothetical protein
LVAPSVTFKKWFEFVEHAIISVIADIASASGTQTEECRRAELLKAAGGQPTRQIDEIGNGGV